MKIKKEGFLYELKKNRTKFLMVSPAIIFFFVMCYIPMSGIVLAFKNFTYDGGIYGSPWCGLDNFKFFFLSGKAWSVTRNTVLFNFVFIVINNFLQILCAVLLTEVVGKRFTKFTQSAMFLPYFISWVVIGAFIYNLFNYEFGVVNTILKQLGKMPLDVYSNKTAWIFILIGVSAFKTLGYGTVMYLATIIGIDVQIFEAADIDGANIFQKIKNITLPSVRPTFIILFLLSIGNIMKGDFQMFYQVVGDNPMVLDTTDVIDTYVVRSLLQLQEFGMSSAAGLYQAFVGFIIIMTVNYIVKKIEPDYALF